MTDLQRDLLRKYKNEVNARETEYHDALRNMTFWGMFIPSRHETCRRTFRAYMKVSKDFMGLLEEYLGWR